MPAPLPNRLLSFLGRPAALSPRRKAQVAVSGVVAFLAVVEWSLLASPGFDACVIGETEAKAQQPNEQPNPSPVGIMIRCGWSVLGENQDAAVAVATIFMALFTGTLWWATIKMQRVSEETLVHLRREFEAEHRPWIPADVQVEGGWRWTREGDGRVALRFMLRNVGRSPATNVEIEPRMFPLGWGFPDPPTAQKELSLSVRRGPISPGQGMGLTLFPDSPPRPFIYDIAVGAADIKRSQQAFKEMYPDAPAAPAFITPIIVGCILYRFLGEQHQTGFMFEVGRVDPDTPNVTLTLDPARGDIPPGQLRLKEFWVGSAIID